MLDAQDIFLNAFLECKPFDDKGRVISRIDYMASEILVSASCRIKGQCSRKSGSVDRLTDELAVMHAMDKFTQRMDEINADNLATEAK